MSTVIRRIHDDTLRASITDPVTIDESYTFIVDVVDDFVLQAIQRHSPHLLRGQPHPTYRGPLLFSQGIEPEQLNGTRAIGVTVRYSSAQPDNPLDQPADIVWDTFTERKLVTHDDEGKPFANTAGELYDEEKDVDYWGFRCVKNVARVPNWVTLYRRAVNRDAITIDGQEFRKETLRLAALNISGRRVENDQPFRTVTLAVLHNPEGWADRYPNVGWHERVETRNSRRNRRQYKLMPVVTPGTGEPATTPQWLDQDGRQLREIQYVTQTIPNFETDIPTELRVRQEVLSVPPHPPSRLLFNDFWFGRRLPFSRLASLFV